MRRGEKEGTGKIGMKGCSKVQQLKSNAGKSDSKKHSRKGEEEVGSQERKNK